MVLLRSLRSGMVRAAEFEACVTYGRAVGLSDDEARRQVTLYIKLCERRGLTPNGDRAREILLAAAMRAV